MRAKLPRSLQASIARRPCESPAPPRSQLDPIAPGTRPIALALSGGGIRAALAGLGTLRLFCDIGRLEDLRHVTSVSGGSIVAGLVACQWDRLRSDGFTQPAFDQRITAPIMRLVTRRSIQRDLLARSWRTLRPSTSRTDVLADLLASTLLGQTQLHELPRGTWFEINAANLTAGTRFRFTQDLVGDYITGSAPSKSIKMRVADAVAWSCAVPGPFNSTVLKELPLPCVQRVGPPELVDGGVYDNLGADALKNRPEMPELYCVVVNAGGSFDPSPRVGRVPLLGDLWRANGVLYQQVSSIRSRQLFGTFTNSEPTAIDGCIFGLRSPFPRDVPPSNTDLLAEFARSNPVDSEARVAELALHPTNLKRVDELTARRLVYRGWWLAGATLSAYSPGLIESAPSYRQPAIAN